MKQTVTLKLGQQNIEIESGRKWPNKLTVPFLSQQAIIWFLVTAVSSKKDSDMDFFPLTVEYAEKFYASGKIPGGFFKREGRPTAGATLNARLIDRPLRPIFPEGYQQRHPGCSHHFKLRRHLSR